MPSDYSIEADEFAVSVMSILDGVKNDIDSGLKSCVREACKTSRDELKKTSPTGAGTALGHYKDGWTYNTRGKRSGVTGEVGNKLKPGLAHLLEKGHARVGGGRVAAHPHIKDAATTGARVLEETCERLADKAVR